MIAKKIFICWVSWAAVLTPCGMTWTGFCDVARVWSNLLISPFVISAGGLFSYGLPDTGGTQAWDVAGLTAGDGGGTGPDFVAGNLC